jgi:hypothetical protein
MELDNIERMGEGTEGSGFNYLGENSSGMDEGLDESSVLESGEKDGREEDVREDEGDLPSSVREPRVNEGIIKRNKGVDKRVLNSAVALGLIGGLVGDSGSDINVGEDREKEADNKLPVTELYNQDTSKEENSGEFTFLPSSVGSGLDSEGFVEEEGIIKGTEEGLINEIKDIIDIIKWDDYKLGSRERIEPKNYIPRDEIYKKGLEVPLYVLPLHEDGFVDKSEPVLKYSLVPAKFNSFKVGILHEVVTPQGDTLTFGSPEKLEENDFNGQFVILMNVKTFEGEVLEFVSEDQDVLLSERIKKDFLLEEGKEELDSSLWENILTVRTDVSPESFTSLLKDFDPSFYCIGEKYDSTYVYNFIAVFDESSALNKFSSEFIAQNKILQELLEISTRVDKLELSASSVCSVEESREKRLETDPNFLLVNLSREYPELNIPIGSFGVYDQGGTEKIILGDSEEKIRKVTLEYSFYQKIIDIFQDENFQGSRVIDIPQRRIVDPNAFLLNEGEFYSYSEEEGQQVELHAGQFSPEDLEIGDIILTGDSKFVSPQYLVVIAKNEGDKGPVLGMIQANRYGQRRFSVLGVDEENIDDVLSERVLIIRGTE